MKISYNWLKELLPEPDLSAEAVANELTLLGLETESITEFSRIPGGLAGVVVGEVLQCVPHPNADRLKLTTVSVGSETPLQIVCGAPNVAAGQRVAVALAGSTIYPLSGEPIVLKKSKIRGETSEGMICSANELGLASDSEGILVLTTDKPAGTPLSEIIPLFSDQILEIGLTPNRTDAMSHYGVARDLAAAKSFELKPITAIAAEVSAATPFSLSVSVTAADQCLRYAGLVIKDITVAPSPDWLRYRLESIGVRSINNVVDATNYILHFLGQPLHAFDLAAVAGDAIIVRNPTADETTFVTLDGQTRQLAADDVLICNARAPMCIAGVMGGLESGVSAGTRAIFLESACFLPASVRKTARRLGLHSESAYRFERGVDPVGVVWGLKACANLIVALAGGQISEAIDILPQGEAVLLPYRVPFSFSRAQRLIGGNSVVDTQTIRAILKRLEINIIDEAGNINENESSDEVLLAVPRYRYDVRRFEDVVEEILRIYGYNNVVPAARLSLALIPPAAADQQYAIDEMINDFLAAQGYFEIMNNSLTAARYVQPATAAVTVANPLSEELAVLRTDLLAGGLAALSYNLNRQQETLAFYEMGQVYQQAGNRFNENTMLGIWTCGNTALFDWQQKPTAKTLFDLKTDVYALFAKLDIADAIEEFPFGLDDADRPDNRWRYGVVLKLKKQQVKVGVIGCVSDEWTALFDIRPAVYYAEIARAVLPAAVSRVHFAPLPQFPRVRRDLSMIVQPEISFKQIRTLIEETNPKLVQSVEIFDVYQPKEKATAADTAGAGSYAIAIFIQDLQQTLTDATIEKLMERIVTNLEKTGKIMIRK